MNNFVNALNVTRTENGALALASSGSALVDFFGLGGALRTRSEGDVKSLFAKAYNEDNLLATKIAFYLRDVRGGQGERETFRRITDWLVDNAPEVLVKNLESIAEFGRYDDLVRLCFSSNELVSTLATEIVERQFRADMEAEHPSLLGKWLPSENASSKDTKVKAVRLAKRLGLSRRDYRLALSSLRNKIKIVEKQMCSREWDGINYEAVPSRAAMIYRKAFTKHDKDGYGKFLAAVEKGEKTIKASALYPYDLYEKVAYGRTVDPTLEAQWKALPDYLKGNKGIVVADTSGSMSGRPIAVAVSLAIYMAERNVGPFKDAFITFSSRPQLQSITGNTLYEKIRTLNTSGWGMNTDVNAVFRLILDRGKAAGLTQEDMPDVIYIVSDMQFDACTNGNQTNFEHIKQMYANAGYVMPALVFWNVNARQTQTPVKANEKGTVLVSGCSPSIFEQAIQPGVTPYDLMMETLSKPRYDVIKV